MAIVVTIGTIGAGMAQEWARPPDAGAVACALLAASSLAWRRSEPLFALGTAVVVVGTYLVFGYAWGPILLCIVVGVFETARQRPWTTSLPASAVAVTLIIIANLLRGVHNASTPGLLLVAWGGWLVIPWSLGALAHVRGAAAERQRRDLAARAKLEERMRVAREVHDIAGHGFATTAMQAGVALLVFDEQPEQAKRSLESIQSTSTKALTELRTMLDAFYPQADGRTAPADEARDEPEVAEQQGSSEDPLGDIAELVHTVRAGGLAVDLDIERMDTTLPPNVGSAAYRVVQESLTNVMRHAGGASATVRVFRDGADLVTEIADRGSGVPSGAPDNEGRGLTGMRERVEAVGGNLSCGPREGGGFQVVARMPIPESRR